MGGQDGRPESSGVPASTFYGGKASPARGLGSKHTYVEQPPNYESESGVTNPLYRAPELVEDQLIPNTDPAALIEMHEDTGDMGPWQTNVDWDNSTPADWWDKHQPISETIIPIDDRFQDEEDDWWRLDVRKTYNRPGVGHLPSELPTLFHDPSHSVCSIEVSQPPVRVPAATSSTSPPPPPPEASPPTNDELRDAKPHPNAYYCRKHNGWIVVFNESSADLPPLSIKDAILPNQERRNATRNCLHTPKTANLTHHFHRYKKAVDAKHLVPKLQPTPWEGIQNVKQRRRGMTINVEDEFDVRKLNPAQLEEPIPEVDEPPNVNMDLYVCCQCQQYFLVSSDVIPGVITPKHVQEFDAQRKDPLPGNNSEVSVLKAWETVISVIESLLWRNQTRPVLVGGSSFSNKVGWSDATRHVFEGLGFRVQLVPNPKPAEKERTPEVNGLIPPNVQRDTPEGASNRSKMLRAWVELSAYAAELTRVSLSALSAVKHTPYPLAVKVEQAQEMLAHRLGLFQLPRSQFPPSLRASFQNDRPEFKELGLTLQHYSHELLCFAYLAQCRCDPANTVEYFTAFSHIVDALSNVIDCPLELSMFKAVQSSRENRFTTEDWRTAGTILGLGNGEGYSPAIDDVDDAYVNSAWEFHLAFALNTVNKDSERDVNNALKIMAVARNSPYLWEKWVNRDKFLTPNKAYETLGAPYDIDEGFLVTVFELRCSDHPGQISTTKHALAVIASDRKSERLRVLAETGVDPGDIIAPTPPGLPRGLNQLGNTCYLNSLLQYFYTVKPLRDMIFEVSNSHEKAEENEKLTDADLLKHRVGGRLVTRREIARSKEFVGQLGHLFTTLKFSADPSITPELKLAKLALVTSKDEEEEEGDTTSSNDTDTTLVDEATAGIAVPGLDLPTPAKTASPTPEPSKVLGKRLRIEKRASMMDLDFDSPSEAGYVMVGSPASSIVSPPKSSSPPDEDEDVEMGPPPLEEVGPPPLPPRRPAPVVDSGSSSTMMFGKQHDVAECMDNCIFQIETALLKFTGEDKVGDETKSIVKTLFYGTLRQRISAAPTASPSRSSVHSKDDMFSHLPVNVTTDGVDLYDGLSRYFDDSIDFEGKEARMEVSLVDLPPLIQIQLQRVQFNRDISQAYKSQAYIQFGETLYLDRFLETADPVKKAKAKVIQTELDLCRTRTLELTREKFTPFAPHIRNVVKFTTQTVDNDDELHQFLNEEADDIDRTIAWCETRAKELKEELEGVWKGEENAAYELTSVFIHRGDTPFFGHYFFYSRNLPDEPDSWFKYNDSDVSVVSKQEVLSDTTGQTANPYLLVYARKNSNVVDTVMRSPP